MYPSTRAFQCPGTPLHSSIPADPHTGLYGCLPPLTRGFIVQGCHATGLGSLHADRVSRSSRALTSVWGPVWLSLGRPCLGIHHHVRGPVTGSHPWLSGGGARLCRPVIPFGYTSPGQYFPITPLASPTMTVWVTEALQSTWFLRVAACGGNLGCKSIISGGLLAFANTLYPPVTATTWQPGFPAPCHPTSWQPGFVLPCRCYHLATRFCVPCFCCHMATRCSIPVSLLPPGN